MRTPTQACPWNKNLTEQSLSALVPKPSAQRHRFQLVTKACWQNMQILGDLTESQTWYWTPQNRVHCIRVNWMTFRKSNKILQPVSRAKNLVSLVLKSFPLYSLPNHYHPLPQPKTTTILTYKSLAFPTWLAFLPSSFLPFFFPRFLPSRCVPRPCLIVFRGMRSKPRDSTPLKRFPIDLPSPSPLDF